MSNPATTGRPSTGSPSYTHYNPNPNPNVSMGAKRVVVNSPVSPRPASNSVVKGGGLNNSHSNLHSSSPTQNTQYNQPSNYGNEAYDNYHDANDNGGHDPVYEQPVNNNPMGNSGHTHSFQQQRNEQYNNHGHQNPNQYHAPNQHNQQQHNQAYHQPSNLANSGNQNHHGNQPNYTANHQQQPSSLSNSAPSPTGSGHFGGSPSYSTSHSQGSLNVPPHLQQGTPSITPLSPQSHSINPNRQSSVKTMMRPHGQGSVSGSYQPVPYQPQNRVESSTISSGYQPTAYQPQAYQPQPYQPQQYHSGATNLTTASPFSAPPQNSVYYSSSGSSGGASSTAGFQPQPYQPPTSNPTSPMRSDSVSYHPPQGGSSGYHGGQQFGPLQMYPQYQHQPSTGVNPNARLSSSHGKTGQPLRVPSNTSISMSNNSGDEASLSPLPLQTQQTIQMSKENSPRQHRPSGSGMPIMGAERENGPSPRQPSPPLNSIGNSSSGSVHNTPPSQSPTSADLGILFENEAFQIGDNPQLAMQLQYISAAFSISDQGAIGSRASGDLTSSSSAVKRKSSPLTPSPNNSGSFKVANTATTTTASSVTPVDPNAHLKTMPKRVERPRHVINFKAPDDDTQVTFTQVDGKTCVKTATFSKIIEKVTATVPCIEQDDVLLCYHSFCVADEILDALILRYEEPSGEDVKTVRLRIFNFIRKWAVSYWYDWILDPSLTQKALDFLERSMDKQDQSKGGVAATVKSIIEKKQLEGDVENQRKRTTEAHSEPSIPMNLDSPGILQYDAVEIARQMTLIEWEIWSNIQHWELLGLAWTKKDKDTTAKNVCCMTDRFNLVSDWVVNVICTTDDAKHRVKVIMKFLKIADELRNMGNYNGVLEIMSGLRRGPVDRMKRSIAGACGQKPFQKIYDELDNLTNSAKAYLNMRNAIKSVNPPLIPYLGMYQTDLLMIDQGNPDEIAGLINYTKYRLSAETIKKIKQYQHINQGYNYRIVDDLYQQLLHCLSPVKLKENEQYDISNHLEPREGKEPGARPECLDRYIQASTEMRLEFFRNRKKDHGDSADQSESDRASDSSAPFIARVSKRSYPGSKKDEDKKEKDSRKSSQPLVGHRGAFNDRSSGSMTSSGTFGNPGSPSRDRDSTSEKSGGTTAASLLLSGGGNSDRGDREAALQNAGSSGSLGGNPARNSSGSIVIRDPVFASNGDHTGQVLDQYGVSHDEDNYSTLEKMIENMLIDTSLQYSTAIVACYRQCFTAQHVIQELARLYNMAKSVNGFQKTSALLRTWIIQYWKDFEDQPELLTLIDQLFGLYDQQFTLYKQKILTPTIEKQRNFSWPPVKDTVFDNLSVESLKPLDFARQLVHHTYDNFISRITINDIIAEINDTVSNPRLYNFNINEPTHQNIVFKLAQGRYAGISGIEFVIGNELKRKNTNNLIRIKKANKDDDVNINSGDQCFTGRRAVKWLHTVLNCPPNVAASWLRLFLNKNIITAVDEKKADVQDLDILWKFTSTTVPAPCNRVLQIEENELVSNFRNMLYQHLTLIQNFILREVKKEHIYKYRGAQALHDFILIAQEVQKLNNWHILLAFVTTFNQISTSPEFREIWEQLSSLDKQWFVQLRNLFTDPQELRKTLISIPSINLHNTSCTILQVLIDDLASVARRFPESPHPEIKINQKRWFELSKGLDFYTRTCSYYPPSFEKLTQIQTFFAQDLLSYSI